MNRRLLKFAIGLAGIGFVTTYPRFQREKEASTARFRLGSQIFQSPAGALEYAVTGQGTPILAIHGAGGGYDQGMLMAQILDTMRCQIIAISRAGYGRTPLSTGYTPENQADAIRALLDHLGIERAVVVAISAGGLASLQFAVRHADRCAGLVMLSAVTPSVLTNLPRPHMIPALHIFWASDYLSWLILQFGRDALMALLGKLESERLQTPAAQRLLNGLFDGMFPMSNWRDGTIRDFEELYAMDRNFPARVGVPTLIIHGTHDTAVLYGAAQAAAKMIPNARLLTIEDGSHLIIGTHIPEIRAAVDEFATSL